MLGGGFLNSRLATRIRVKDGLSYGVGSRVRASSHEPDGEFMVLCDCRAAERSESGSCIQGRVGAGA